MYTDYQLIFHFHKTIRINLAIALMFLPPQTDYSNYLTAFGVTGVVGQVVAIPFLSNKMRWSDTTILIVTTSTAVANQERALTYTAGLKYYSYVARFSHKW